MDIQSPSISSLMDDVVNGRVVLPDFQRDFVWKVEDIKDLLISALADYYVGTMLYMDDLVETTDFATRLIYGVESRFPTVEAKSIIKLLLDGQQRCSAIFYALYEPSLPLFGRKSPYRFVLHIPDALLKKWDDAVIGYAVTNKRDAARYSGEDYIHFREFVDASALIARLSKNKWTDKFPDIFNIVNGFNQFKIQMVELKRGTPIDTVVEIFERINRTGMPLNITDLLTARLVRKDIKLRDLVDSAQESYQFAQDDVGIPSEFILRTICLMQGKEITKSNILHLSSNTFSEDWKKACGCLDQAYRMMTSISGGFGAADFKRFAPFKTILIPLAVILWHVENSTRGTAPDYAKVSEWYWASVFGNRYNEAVNSTTFSDCTRMRDWLLEKSPAPEFIRNFNPQSVDLFVTSKSSATYRGILCQILLNGASDFKSGKQATHDLAKLQDDHIFPRAGFNDNSILNRTLITSNSEKSNQHPSKYFGALETVHGRDGLLDILRSHLMDEHCLDALLSNNIEAFKRSRRMILSRHIATLVPSADGMINQQKEEEMQEEI
ncbi:DUF262 domain-containing protein [Azospirillum sp. BE72]|uniref:GmrSD restriction endonuclease domain-containing protein n=1 Tax=Azospirillum sp. BE72 TaxID=2817776 RepID=UPI00286073FF|nr:DUF262 domain-containing protein [Azospirillum sp. BE72]MDR6770231.1 hypothetical protein [Azospirillum sp. BE72]